MERSSILLDMWGYHHKNGNLAKSNPQIRGHPHKNPNTIFHRPGKNNSQKNIPGLPKQHYNKLMSLGITSTVFNHYYRATILKTVLSRHKNRQIDQEN